uniref:Uncharacterized protein n=1 Tax=Pristionchus pacificus TaxID=54126 RepID=A0A2A6BP76_PRIPA|eukprot:PDM67709.1 hypothetical protein PRIPAC_45753 [Pristionchus pacificus]
MDTSQPEHTNTSRPWLRSQSPTDYRTLFAWEQARPHDSRFSQLRQHATNSPSAQCLLSYQAIYQPQRSCSMSMFTPNHAHCDKSITTVPPSSSYRNPIHSRANMPAQPAEI